MKKIKTSQSGQKKDGKKVSKKDAGLNCIGYPHDDPYGLIAAFKLAFGFNTKKWVTMLLSGIGIQIGKEEDIKLFIMALN